MCNACSEITTNFKWGGILRGQISENKTIFQLLQPHTHRHRQVRHDMSMLNTSGTSWRGPQLARGPVLLEQLSPLGRSPFLGTKWWLSPVSCHSGRWWQEPRTRHGRKQQQTPDALCDAQAFQYLNFLTPESTLRHHSVRSWATAQHLSPSGTTRANRRVLRATEERRLYLLYFISGVGDALRDALVRANSCRQFCVVLHNQFIQVTVALLIGLF